MDQSINAQPKLLLRRTESIVEKLLTNWMSICLYGFLRVRVFCSAYLFDQQVIPQLICLLLCYISVGVSWSTTLSDGISSKPADF